jgi:V8-like Glu-specific endopeptidase
VRGLASCLLGIVAACGPLLPPETQVAHSEGAIINGTLSLDDTQVFALGNATGMFCSATLIADRTLLTAAHCLEAETGAISASNHADVKGWPADAIAVVDRRVHPKWVNGDTAYDVGLLLLASAPGVVPKPWNRTPLSMAKVPQVRAVGFGETHLNGSGVRYEAMLKVSALTSSTLYLGDDAAATCFGDSGGPSMFTGSDGVERVVGVHSFANSTACNGGGDMRVDGIADFIDQWTRDKAPTCSLDGACVLECPGPDPDCSCVADGVCSARCPLPDTDPDCPKGCLLDGVCAFGTCGAPDPDCREDGASCASSDGCAGHQCLTDAQHEVAYCSRTCHSDTECSPSMRCSFGVCSYPVLPLATMGEACVVGHTVCSGGICGGQSADTAICHPGCGPKGACPGTMQCVRGVLGVEYCQGTAVLPQLAGQTSVAAPHCSASGAEASLLLVLLWLRRRR